MTLDPLRAGRNPARQLCSSGTWRAALYLVTYPVLGTLLFGTAFAMLALATATGLTWLGLPVALAAGHVVRGGAVLERRRTGWVGGTARPADLPPPARRGVYARLRAVWAEPSTRRAAVYLLPLWLPLLVLDLVAVLVFAACCAAASLPLWFWAIPSPGVLIGFGSHPDAVGVHVSTLPAALVTAVVGVVLAAAASYLLVGAAWLHRGVVRTLLGPPVNPLAQALLVLDSPGPLYRHAQF